MTCDYSWKHGYVCRLPHSQAGNQKALADSGEAAASWLACFEIRFYFRVYFASLGGRRLPRAGGSSNLSLTMNQFGH